MGKARFLFAAIGLFLASYRKNEYFKRNQTCIGQLFIDIVSKVYMAFIQKSTIGHTYICITYTIAGTTKKKIFYTNFSTNIGISI